MQGVNPRILSWARERSGQELEKVAKALGKSPADILSWEEGTSAPTYVQLEKLAYKVYKRPVAVFFFPAPPEEPDPKHSFRTLPDFEIETLDADTRFKIRDARVMQLFLHDLNHGHNPAERLIFRDFKVTPSGSAAAIAEEIRSYLEVDLSEQLAWKSTDEALKVWRERVEREGIFVFKNSFQSDDVSGICLTDSEFPIIYLNNSTTKTRQIFTLFHELAHILLATNGITKLDDKYIDFLEGQPKRIEVFCNQLAGDLLVPAKDLRRRIRGREIDDLTVAEAARAYSVSREVILRRLLDLGLLPRDQFEQKLAQLREEYQQLPKGESGGNYYATQAAYLGQSYMRLVFSRYYDGAFSIVQLAEYLKMKVASVPRMEDFFLRQAVA